MKKLLPLLLLGFVCLFSYDVTAQTGSGVVLLTQPTHTFTPTTVDSTSVFEFQLVNTVGIEQTVYFGGLDTPYVLSDDQPTLIAANDTIDLSISFTPDAIGTTQDTLEVLGSIYGSAALVVSGDGIQVTLDWTVETVTFDITALGQTSTDESLVFSSVGDGTGTLEVSSISAPEFTVEFIDPQDGSEFIPGSVPEGDQRTVRLSFSPSIAGNTSGQITFTTNDPNNPEIVINLEGEGISEVQGEFCDATWDLINSPFTLVGDVTVPEGCSLTIEPGVVVDMAGFDLIIDGEFECNGTSEQPISATGGILQFNEGAPTSISYLSISSEYNPDYEYELLYYNNFESSSNQYDFDCYNFQGDYYHTGTTTSYNNGCSNWSRSSSSNWASPRDDFQDNNGWYFMYFHSNDYDGALYLDEPVIASYSGLYEISFRYESDRFERDCFLSIEVKEDGQWVPKYSSPYDIQSESQFARIARAEFYANAGEEIEFRIKQDIGSTSSDYDYMYTYIDNFRIEKKRVKSNVVKWNLAMSFNDFEDYGNAVSLDGDTLRIFANNNSSDTVTNTGTISFNTSSFNVAPIIVPESGWYNIKVTNRMTKQDRYNYFRLKYKSLNNNNGWYYIIQDETPYGCSSCWESNYPYSEWRDDEIEAFEYFTAGSRIDFSFYSYVYSSSSDNDEMYWEGYDFELFQLENVPEPDAMLEGILSNRDITANNLSGGGIDFTNNTNSEINNSDITRLEFMNGGELVSTNLENEFIHSSNNLSLQTENCILGSVFSSQNLTISDSGSQFSSIYTDGDADITTSNSVISNYEGIGIELNGDNSSLTMNHTIVSGHGGDGINMAATSGSIHLENCIVSGNGGSGIISDVPGLLNYVTIADNDGDGWNAGNTYNSSLTNSLFSYNDNSDYSGWITADYIYAGELPYFQEGGFMLNSYSPAVDAAMPWNTDQNMPFGMGGLRADQGAYGGPNNAGWGGTPAPDGAPEISSVSDSPQDQGNVVGLTFDASAFDNTILQQNVTHYAFWRHYDPTGQNISTLDEGSWELLGEMPAQNFNGYAYQASTLGNTNIFGTFNSCFTVVAHTDDEDTYWYSNVMCGESEDNLAPDVPEIQGMVLETGEVQIMWTTPFEEDYAYTEVSSDAGFTADVTGDTLSIDATVELGGTYTYTAIHYDVNGNASDSSTLTMELEAGSDEIVLHAGWNLISTDRIPNNANVAEVFSGLTIGNLQYVTGFNSGVQFYDPNGLEFLNSLGSLDNGYGYWVKVLSDDILHVQGTQLSDGYLPPLNEGWNLVGHANELAIAPEVVFEDLYASGDLLYVTGFDQGVQVYDPDGLPFLNTLTEMRNGFGYWVKSAVATDGGVLAPTVGDEVTSVANPRYAVLNGTSNLEAFAGEFVHVINARGNTVSRLEILPGGYLMTTALYEDENGMYGLRPGDALRFSFHGSIVEMEGYAFKGEMEHVKLNLEFPELQASLAVFPNPITSTSHISFTLLEKGEVLVELIDIQGRVLAILDQGARTEGLKNIEFNASDLAAGTYAIRLTVDGAEVSSKRVVKAK